ncbi:hypothetical protein [Staphylococcus sp. GDY8P57P]|uniref:hypothetical protein n=1 Tax=Staphylococcus sp. GDY8P57P TaxID=2804128 RepID=UPI001AEC0360|nr:hypothetical protein [Staphylococcus sp. GDY8P57P]
MKKIIASLGVIALVAVLGVAVVFAYGSYKDLELKKEEAKLAENKIKEDDKKEKSKKIDNNGKEESNNTTNYQTPVTNEDVSTKEVRTTEDGEVIKKTKNGIDYVGEFDSPDEEEKYEQEVMAQSGGGDAANEDSTEETQPKYTAEDANNMSDDEFIDAYKEGMTEDQAAAVDEAAERSGDYIGFLRGQVEARANGQGGNY